MVNGDNNNGSFFLSYLTKNFIAKLQTMLHNEILFYFWWIVTLSQFTLYS